MYLDDSASHGAILDEGFESIPVQENGLIAVSTVGGIVVKRNAEARIIREIDSLRYRIQKSLALDDLPPLHMREMWGSTKADKKSPYFLATKEQCFRWVRAAYDIIFKYGELGLLKTCGVALEIPQAQEVLLQHYLTEDIQIENEIIRTVFPKAADDYYNIVLNPLWRGIMNMIAIGNYYSETRHHNLDIYYDTSQSSKGFATSQGMQMLREVGHFPRIKTIEEASPKTSSLMQLADVAQYNFFRKKLIEYRVANKKRYAIDIGMDKARRFRNTSSIALEGTKMRVESLHERQFTMLQTVFGAQKIRIEYPDMCDLYLIDPYLYDVSIAPLNGTTGFFQLIRSEVIEAWRNGKRPPM